MDDEQRRFHEQRERDHYRRRQERFQRQEAERRRRQQERQQRQGRREETYSDDEGIDMSTQILVIDRSAGSAYQPQPAALAQPQQYTQPGNHTVGAAAAYQPYPAALAQPQQYTQPGPAFAGAAAAYQPQLPGPGQRSHASGQGSGGQQPSSQHFSPQSPQGNRSPAR